MKSPHFSPQILNYLEQIKAYFDGSGYNFELQPSFLKVLQWCEKNNINKLSKSFGLYYLINTRPRTPNEELLCYIEWYSKKNPELSAEVILADAVFFIKSIQVYIYNAKEIEPHINMDIVMMQIIECVGNCPIASRVVSRRSHHIDDDKLLKYSTALREATDGIEEEIDRESIQLLYYVIRIYPELSSVEAIQKAREVRQIIERYLSIDRKRPYYEYELNIRIPLYLWCAEKYKKLSLEKVIFWANNVVKEGVYFHQHQAFSNKNAFRYINICLNLDGRGCISFDCITNFHREYFTSLSGIIEDFYEGPPRRFYINFNLNKKDTLDSILNKVGKLFAILESYCIDKDTDKLNAIKKVCDSAVKDFASYHFHGTPGPQYTVAKQPQDSSEWHPDTEIDREIFHILAEFNCAAMQRVLGEKSSLLDRLDPNRRYYNDTYPLSGATKNVWDYEVYTRYGMLAYQDMNVLWECKNPLHNPPKVIITKCEEGYELFWGEEKNIVEVAPEKEDTVYYLGPVSYRFLHPSPPKVVMVKKEDGYVIFTRKDLSEVRETPWLYYMDCPEEDLSFYTHLGLKFISGDVLYERDDNHAIKFRRIMDNETVNFLNEQADKFFSLEGKFLRPFSHTRDRHFIRNHLGPILNETHWEVKRCNAANQILDMITTLLSYGARSFFLEYKDHHTLVEKCINDYAYPKADTVNRRLKFDILKLLLPFDNEQSNLRICRENAPTKIVRLINAYSGFLKNGDKIPPSIKAVKYIRESIVPKVEFTTAEGDLLSLAIISLKDLEKYPQTRDDIIELGKACFRKYVAATVTDEELVNYMEEKLISPNSRNHKSVLNLLYSAQDELVAFNVSDVIIPGENSAAPISHFIRLAATNESKRGAKITSLMHYQLTLFLIVFYNDALVLTAFSAASALSYLLVSDLTVYPKYQCLFDYGALDLSQIQSDNSLLSGGEGEWENGFCYFKTNVSYMAKSRAEDKKGQIEIPKLSDIEREMYNKRLAKPGHSTLVAFWSTPENIEKLRKKINFLQQVAEAAYPLNVSALELWPKSSL